MGNETFYWDGLIVTGYFSKRVTIMHLSFASPWLDPRDTPLGTHGSPGGMVQFWYFFFPRGGGELFSFGRTGFARVLVSGISL